MDEVLKKQLDANEPAAWQQVWNALGKLCQPEAWEYGEYLVTRFTPYVSVIARRYLQDKEDVKDACQETFVQVFQARNRYDPERGDFRGWIASIAVHVAINIWRKPPVQGHDAGAPPEIERILNLATRNSEPEQVTIHRETLERVKQCLRLSPSQAHLSAREKNIFLLVYSAHCTPEDVSTHLGINVSTVRSTLSHTRTHLRACVEG